MYNGLINRCLISLMQRLSMRMIIHRIGIFLPKRGSRSFSKQCFKHLLPYKTFPVKTLPAENSFPPGCCLCVCSSFLSAFIYLALQSCNCLSTCAFTCVCPMSLFRRYVLAGAWNTMFFGFPMEMLFFLPGARREFSSIFVMDHCAFLPLIHHEIKKIKWRNSHIKMVYVS